MAYTLKTSGLATQLVHCIGVDEDGTIKDFVVGSTVTIASEAGLTKSAEQWRSATSNGGSHPYFQTGATSFLEFGAANKPVFTLGAANSIFVAFAGTGGVTRDLNYPSHLFGVSTTSRLYGASYGNFGCGWGGGAFSTLSSVSAPATLSGQHSLAIVSLNSTTYDIQYDAASVITGTPAGSNSATGQSIKYIGTEDAGSTNNRFVARYGIICQFSCHLPTYDANAIADLNADWFGTLFQASGGGVLMPKRAMLLGLG